MPPTHVCGVRASIVTRLDPGSGEVCLMLWCPACGRIALNDENSPTRGIVPADINARDFHAYVLTVALDALNAERGPQ